MARYLRVVGLARPSVNARVKCNRCDKGNPFRPAAPRDCYRLIDLFINELNGKLPPREIAFDIILLYSYCGIYLTKRDQKSRNVILKGNILRGKSNVLANREINI